MSCYTVQLDRPHATKPTICWRVLVFDLVHGGALSELSGHNLYVPMLESWIPDTLRLVLYELSAYLPAHDSSDALVRVSACLTRRAGRTPKVPRPPRFDDDVKFSVETQGWRAEVETKRNDERRSEKPDAPVPQHPGYFTEPMQAFLLELAAQSPLSLASIAPEYSAPADERGQNPSRLGLRDGAEAAWDGKKWRWDIADHVYKQQQILKKLRGERRQ